MYLSIIFEIFTIDNESGYLKHTVTNRCIGVYNNQDWRCYTDKDNFAGQTLKFYKRECLDATNYWVTWDANEGTWTDGSSNKLESYQGVATITAPTENPTREGYRFDGWTPAPTIMPAQNTTFTAKWTEVYTITWYENGVPSYTYVPSDNAVVTWEDNIADCGEKKFYGWTVDDTFVSDPTTPPTLISKGTTIAGDVTYYAVYADAEEPANPGYTKVTTISEGTYLIATGETSSNKAYTGKYPDKTYGGTCDVTVNNQVISTKPTSAVEVEVTLGTGANSGKFAIYDGTYYLSAPNDNALTFNGNIAIPEGGAVTPIAVALTVNGEPRLTSRAIYTPAAVDEYGNVTSTAIITVPRGCCFSLSVRYVDATTDDPATTPTPSIQVQNANVVVDRIA